MLFDVLQAVMRAGGALFQKWLPSIFKIKCTCKGLYVLFGPSMNAEFVDLRTEKVRLCILPFRLSRQ